MTGFGYDVGALVLDETATAPDDGPGDEDDVDHIICCDEEDLTLCGTQADPADTNYEAEVDGSECETCFRLHMTTDCNVLCPVAALRAMRGTL